MNDKLLDEKTLLGLTEDTAVLKIKEAGMKCRVLERDGVRVSATRDIRGNRMNLDIKDGLVIKAYIG